MYNTQKILQLIFLFNLYGLMCPCTVLSAPSQGDYISDIQSEYDNQGETQEIVIVKPETPNQSLSDVIFDKKLTKEFQSRYEYEFGRTAFEQNADIPLRYEEYITADNQLISAQEDIQRRQVFGEYIVKRLSEHHIDEYVKSNPSTRPMFELKERISHLNMSVKKGYRLKMHYSYSGNYMDFKLDNPYDIKTKLTLEMNPGGLGPSHIYETQLSLEYPLEKTVSLASDYKFDDGILKLVAKKSLSPTTSASLSGSTFTKSEGVSARDQRLLIGFSWSQ